MEFLNDKNQFVIPEFNLQIKSKARGIRSCIIEDFVIELNKDVGKKYKKGEKLILIKSVRPAFIAFKLSHLTVDDMFYFLSKCRQSKSFRGCFYSELKVKTPFP